MNEMNRRGMLKMAALGGVAGTGILNISRTVAQEARANRPEKNQMRPLTFNPRKLNGLSEKLIMSHYENNYGGAVKNLAKVEAQLSQTTAETPAFVVAGLRASELAYRNSMVLHEMYFANLGGDGRPSGKIEKRIAESFGSFGKWEEQFRAAGAGLGGGSGWVVLSYSLRDNQLVLNCGQHNNQAGALSVPLLLMDMYEHAYHIDFGTAVPKYVDAFFKNIQWDEVNRRLEVAESMNLKNI